MKPKIYAVTKDGQFAGAIVKNGFSGMDERGHDKPGENHSMLRMADEAIERAKRRGYAVKPTSLEQLKTLMKGPSSPAQANTGVETGQKSFEL